MNLSTVTSRATAAFVATVAGFASYQHIYRVATKAGEHQSVSAVLPLSIDGLILVATLAMLEDKRNQRQPRLSARVALAFGIIATLAANVASAQPTITARMVAAVPALSFLLAVEVLARSGKPATKAATATRQEHASTIQERPATSTPAGQALTAIVDVTTPATVTTPEPATSTPRRAAKKTPTKPATGRQSNAERIAKEVAKQPAIKQAEVAARLNIGERTVQRYWPKPEPATTTANGYDHATAEVN